MTWSLEQGAESREILDRYYVEHPDVLQNGLTQDDVRAIRELLVQHLSPNSMSISVKHVVVASVRHTMSSDVYDILWWPLQPRVGESGALVEDDAPGVPPLGELNIGCFSVRKNNESADGQPRFFDTYRAAIAHIQNTIAERDEELFRQDFNRRLGL